MDIRHQIETAKNLTPTEALLGQHILAFGEEIQTLGIKEIASSTNTSVASIHRFCKKLGLEGLKELKVELARASERNTPDIDINFPFSAGEYAAQIMPRMEALYERTLADTRGLLDISQMNYAAELVGKADIVDIYTCSHNLYPASMFRDRLLSVGKIATCHASYEQRIRTAASSNPHHVALAISYSGLNDELRKTLPVLTSTKTPVIIIGTAYCAQLHPGFAAYLTMSDLESFTRRITQFASHVALQYILDSLFSCYFARNYNEALDALENSFQYTRLSTR